LGHMEQRQKDRSYRKKKRGKERTELAKVSGRLDEKEHAKMVPQVKLRDRY